MYITIIFRATITLLAYIWLLIKILVFVKKLKMDALIHHHLLKMQAQSHYYICDWLNAGYDVSTSQKDSWQEDS